MYHRFSPKTITLFDFIICGKPSEGLSLAVTALTAEQPVMTPSDGFSPLLLCSKFQTIQTGHSVLFLIAALYPFLLSNVHPLICFILFLCFFFFIYKLHLKVVLHSKVPTFKTFEQLCLESPDIA